MLDMQEAENKMRRDQTSLCAMHPGILSLQVDEASKGARIQVRGHEPSCRRATRAV